MLKQEILEFAKKWGYVLVYSEYSRKARRHVWAVKVPTTTFKDRPGFVRTRKVLEDDDLDQLLEKAKKYFAERKSPIKVILRENRYSNTNDDKKLFYYLNLQQSQSLYPMNHETSKTRLYFTEQKICIGSYDEVAQYEQRTGQSYWASDFFELPPNYDPVGKALDAIQIAQRQWSAQTK